jgi:hypothetical protein
MLTLRIASRNSGARRIDTALLIRFVRDDRRRPVRRGRDVDPFRGPQQVVRHRRETQKHPADGDALVTNRPNVALKGFALSELADVRDERLDLLS